MLNIAPQNYRIRRDLSNLVQLPHFTSEETDSQRLLTHDPQRHTSLGHGGRQRRRGHFTRSRSCFSSTASSESERVSESGERADGCLSFNRQARPRLAARTHQLFVRNKKRAQRKLTERPTSWWVFFSPPYKSFLLLLSK